MLHTSIVHLPLATLTFWALPIWAYVSRLPLLIWILVMTMPSFFHGHHTNSSMAVVTVLLCWLEDCLESLLSQPRLDGGSSRSSEEVFLEESEIVFALHHGFLHKGKTGHVNVMDGQFVLGRSWALCFSDSARPLL